MRAVIQRVTGAALSVDGKVYSSIGCGLVVFLGIGKEDNQVTAEKFAKKIAALRIFSDSNDKMNLSVKDIGGEILLVPNFTLCGDSSHGNRPTFPQRLLQMRKPQNYSIVLQVKPIVSLKRKRAVSVRICI